MKLKCIGTVESCYKDKLGSPRQSGLAEDSWAIIRLAPEYSNEHLAGLEGFSHLWVSFGFHLNDSEFKRSKVRPPRLGKRLGVFATRSPHRPNSLGLSLVKVLSISAGQIHVGGVDILDGSPVFDLKPYIPSERVEDARFGWLDTTRELRLEVRWSDQAQLQLQQLRVPDRFVRCVDQSLALDPRPLTYRSSNPSEQKYVRCQKIYRSHIDHFDVEFTTAGDRIEVLSLTPRTS